MSNVHPDFKREVSVQGTGAVVKKGDTINAHYRGTLASNGKQFDASYDRGEPLKFKVGAGQVIQGWDVGFEGLNVGSKAKLSIPPEMAYGSAGVGNGLIPGNSTLIFEIEVVEIL